MKSLLCLVSFSAAMFGGYLLFQGHSSDAFSPINRQGSEKTGTTATDIRSSHASSAPNSGQISTAADERLTQAERVRTFDYKGARLGVSIAAFRQILPTAQRGKDPALGMGLIDYLYSAENGEVVQARFSGDQLYEIAVLKSIPELSTPNPTDKLAQLNETYGAAKRSNAVSPGFSRDTWIWSFPEARVRADFCVEVSNGKIATQFRVTDVSKKTAVLQHRRADLDERKRTNGVRRNEILETGLKYKTRSDEVAQAANQITRTYGDGSRGVPASVLRRMHELAREIKEINVKLTLTLREAEAANEIGIALAEEEQSLVSEERDSLGE
jgi:hypothetical protein